jgi:hypothetical protein
MVWACKDKKRSLQSDEATVADFIEFYPQVSLPIMIPDSLLQRKPNDSLEISHNTFTRFIPDSIFKKDFGKSAVPKTYALARAVEKGKEKYLFTEAVAGSKRVAYLACFSNDDKFLKAMPLVRTGFEHYSSAYGLLDSKFQITTYHDTKKANGELVFKRNIYFYDRNSDNFTLIVTEPNEEIIQDVINPIDTLPAQHKYAGDYVQNSRNYISIRDGKNASELQIFVHFEKNNGECTGEIKGTARLVTPTIAQYSRGDNPCLLELAFGSNGNKITMKEKGGCGSFRDITCFFEGSFWKKKKAAAKPRK